MISNFRCIFWLSLMTGYFYSAFSSGENKIPIGGTVRDGGETIISAGKKFEMGFFSPNGSGFRYLGIWHFGISVQTVVWVANRNAPLTGKDGVLTMGNDGNLQITHGADGKIVWSTNVTAVSSNSTAVLMDSGNLAIRPNAYSKTVLWQSFDHPTDTYLPDMEVHIDAAGGEQRVFTSWRSAIDPSPGNYTLGLDPRGSPQIVIWEGTKRRWRSGHWNGISFIGVPDVRTIYLSGFRLTNQGNGSLFFTYTPSDSSFVKFQISWDGVERQETWNNRDKWSLVQAHPVDDCDSYNRCGAFGICDRTDGMRCRCLEGFTIEDGEKWCMRSTGLQCGQDVIGNDDFVEVENVKLPDFVDYVGFENENECQQRCLRNCSCTAYAFVSGINCMIWTGDLLDIERFVDGGNTLFLRLAASESGKSSLYI